MKKLLCVACILLCGFSFADDDKNCREWSKTAGSIMAARQANISLYKNLEVVEEVYGKDEKAVKAVKKIVLMAYEQPQFSLEEYQSKAIIDFENKIMLGCMKAKM